MMEQSKYILDRHECKVEVVGGKAANLAKLQELDYLVPAWFVVAPAAFYACLPESEALKLQNCTDSKEICELIEHLSVTDLVKQQINESIATLSSRKLFAVRSSALDEDGEKHSFAGQLDSFLNVKREDVAEAVVKVWRSAFSRRLIAYRQLNGLPVLPKAPAVIVQVMIDADFSGVSFSIDPISGSPSTALVCCTCGTGDKLVSGDVDGNTYHVGSNGVIVERTVTQESPADKWISLIADSARTLSKQLKCEQDVEWALSEDKLYMLQARPITSAKKERITIWDNSNIGESYPGVTTPLTFSFARKAYENVYLTFCQFMGVSSKTIKANQQVFPNMIGLLHGRIYYNLINWYRLLSILPGYRSNKQFMEQMMGLKEPLPEYATVGIAPEESHGLARVADTISLAGSIAGVGGNYFTLASQMRQFEARFSEALNSVEHDLSSHSPDQLASLYRELERKLLRHWDAPLTNDFFAMIFYGLLRKMTESLAENDDRFSGLYNDLLCGQTGIISTEPARMMREMARVASDHKLLVASLLNDELPQLTKAIAKVEQFQSLYKEYLHQFGDRCLEELKLESATLHDDPLPLLRNIGYLAQREVNAQTGSFAFASPKDTTSLIRQHAESMIVLSLQSNPAKLAVYQYVLAEARNRVRDRENLRFKRTQLFGTVRRIFKAIAIRFQQLTLIEDVDDIFYLEVEEILGLIEGTSCTISIKEIINVRKAEFNSYRNEPTLPTRIETSGLPQIAKSIRAKTAAVSTSATQAKGKLQGLGCCAGTVTGPVRVVTDPRTAAPMAGEILVAERTDPGWIIVFGQALGMIVEHGSLLSHTAIVARELGIPAAVSVAGAVTTLKTGDWVELNGSTGEVTIIETPTATAITPNTVIEMRVHPAGDRAHA